MREYFGIAASDNICNTRMRGIMLHIFQSFSHNCLDVYLEGIFALTDTEISIMADTCRVVLWLSTLSVNALKVGDYGNWKHFFWISAMAEASAEEPKTEESEAKTVQDVLKMSGKDEVKFGVLIGLIKVDQVPNRDVVDTVLNLVCISSSIISVLYFPRVLLSALWCMVAGFTVFWVTRTGPLPLALGLGLTWPGDWSHWLVALTVTIIVVTGTCHLALFLVSTY